MGYASILKKIFMAVSGLVWIGFAVGHLGGNLLLFQGPEPFNAYADFLEGTGELLILVELGLTAFLALHVIMGIKVSLENRQARAGSYAVGKTNGQASLASRSMLAAGILLLIFLVVHVRMFKFGVRPDEGGLWMLVIQTFQDPLWVAFYVVCMLALGLHLSHGFGSAFQSLGVARPSLRGKLKLTGAVLGWVVALGFISLPLYAFLLRQA